MEFLYEGLLSITWQQVVMYCVGGFLIWLAIEKQYEPSLLLPMGFGAILVNLPLSGVIDQMTQGVGETNGIIQWLFEAGIEASEAFPLLLFIGIGAMIDFGPLLANPKLFLFGAAAQVGIFLTIIAAALLGFDIIDAASIGIIGAADGPTSILVSQVLGSRYVGAIAVAAYSYMALVPIIQPFAIKLVTTKRERAMKMPYAAGQVSRRTRILFPIVVSIVAGLVAPASVSLVGFLMFGNLIRECGEWTSAEGAQAVREMYAQGIRPDGIFALNDLLAMGVISQLREMRVRVPESVRVVGFDDIDEAKYTIPSLTTVDPQRARIAEIAITSILDQVKTGARAPRRRIDVEYSLRYRASSPQV